MVAPINFKQRGFSLIELVVVTGLVGLLSVGLVNMFLSSVRGSQRARLQAEIKSQGDYALASMERVLRNVATMPTCVPTNDSLVAVVRRSSTAVGSENETDQYAYTFSNQTINVSINSDDASPLFSTPVVVENVLFECSADAGEAGRILISFTLGVTDGSAPDQQFQTTISIRNNY